MATYEEIVARIEATKSLILMSPEEKNARRATQDAQKQADKEAAADEQKFKDYKIGSGTKYPILTKYLQKNIFRDDVMKSSRILEKMTFWSGGENVKDIKTIIEKAVTYHNPPNQSQGYRNLPTIFISQFDSEEAGGRYDKKIIYIGKHIADLLENEQDKEAALYIVFATLVHETTHYVDWLIDNKPIITTDGAETGHMCEVGIFRSILKTFDGEKDWVTGYEYKETKVNKEGVVVFDKETSMENARKQIETFKENEETKTIIPTLPT